MAVNHDGEEAAWRDGHAALTGKPNWNPATFIGVVKHPPMRWTTINPR
jgi:hypothetical protein